MEKFENDNIRGVEYTSTIYLKHFKIDKHDIECNSQRMSNL